ncbi:BRCT domain-containing protein [Motiliproteus sp.]|uniref:BRCT domain-containing protein n=1 Tax=Motiliproteus sp. TaxID=1898955 RepID=UPI003BACD0FE
MASAKPTSILRSKTDLSEEEIGLLSDAEAWRLIYSDRVKRSKDSRLQVCFTGFGASKREALTLLAGENKFKVVGSVTKKLDYLVCGDSAGPKKIEKAESQGVQSLNEEQFVALVETGVLPAPVT